MNPISTGHHSSTPRQLISFVAARMPTSLCVALGILGVLGLSAGGATAQQPPAAADTAAARAPSYRSPARARALGIVPGLGHMYAEDFRRGVALMVGTPMFAVVGGWLYQLDVCGLALSPCDQRKNRQNRIGGALLMAMGGALWVTSVVDSPRAAERTNRLRRLSIDVRPPDARSPEWRVGTNITMR